ncbi:MAG: hypothetical protein WBW84_10960 [Acidobacteriaceae bacterium]
MNAVKSITGFLGYGNPRESVWFIAIEEGLGDANSTDAAENLKARGTFKQIMDLRDAHHERLRENGTLIDFDKPPTPPVWQWIAKIMRGYHGKDDWRDIKPANEYIRRRLGRSDGITFLTELSPIPSKKAADKTWMDAFNKLDRELPERLEVRKKCLLQLLNNSLPQMVICYGDGQLTASEYAQFLGAEWTPIGERIHQDSKKRAYPLLLLPFFGFGQMSHSVIEEMYKLRFLPGPSARS